MRKSTRKSTGQAGVAELKANLSSFLRRVKAGNEVLILEHGLPVAKIVPLDRTGREDSRERRLVKAGLLIPAKGKMPASLLDPPKRFPRGASTGGSVLEALIEDRREGR